MSSFLAATVSADPSLHNVTINDQRGEGSISDASTLSTEGYPSEWTEASSPSKHGGSFFSKQPLRKEIVAPERIKWTERKRKHV
jgi:hypothetical protein